VVFEIDMPITRGQPVTIYCFSNRISGRINKLEGILNPKSGETLKKNPRCLMKNQTAIVHIKLEDKACLELFSNYRALGRITLRDG
jgi:elongation factor 1 alpha-like protein